MRSITKEKILNNYVEKDGCWLWSGSTIKHGYGQIHTKLGDKYVTILAHRFFYEHHKGSIPDGHHICHDCDNPNCVNPDHLWVGTQKDNMIDMINKGRSNHIYGERHTKAKLTDSQVIEVREKYSTGRYTQQELANLYKIDRSSIGRIVRFDTWRRAK